jgi:hypothetical protein
LAQHRRKVRSRFRQTITLLTVLALLVALFPSLSVRTDAAAASLTLSKSSFSVGYAGTTVTLTGSNQFLLKPDLRIGLYDQSGRDTQAIGNIVSVDNQHARFTLNPGLVEGRYTLLVTSYETQLLEINILTSYDPTNVRITPGVSRDIRLDWADPNALTAREIVIQYAPIEQTYYSPSTEIRVPLGQQQHVLRDLIHGKSYKFKLYTHKTDNTLTPGVEFTNGGAGYKAADTTPPKDITNLSVHAVNNGFDLNWTDPDDADLKFITVQYAVHGTTDWSDSYVVPKGGQHAYLQSMNTAKRYDFRFTKTDLTGNYSYQIDTHGGYGYTFDTDSPSEVTSLDVSAASDTSAVLTWYDPETDDFHHVNVYLASAQDGSDTAWKYVGRAAKGLQSLTISGLHPNIDYVAKVVAVDSYGNETPGRLDNFHLDNTDLDYLWQDLTVRQEAEDGLSFQWDEEKVSTVDFTKFKVYYSPVSSQNNDEWKEGPLTNKSLRKASLRSVPAGTYNLQLRYFDRYGITQVLTTLNNGGDGYYISGNAADIPAEVTEVRFVPADGKMKVTWSANARTRQNVLVYYAEKSSSPRWTLAGQTDVNNQQFSITNLSAAKDYYFKLVVRNNDTGAESPGKIYDNNTHGYNLNGGDTYPPGEVTNASASLSNGSLAVSYDEPGDDDLDSILIYATNKATGEVSTFTVPRGSDGTVLRELLAGTYSLKITTKDLYGNESRGVTLNNGGDGYTIRDNSGFARDEVRHAILIPDGNRLTVRWNEPLDPNYRRAIISLDRIGGTDEEVTEEKGTTEHTFYGLESNVQYAVKIVAVSGSNTKSAGIYLGGDSGINLIPLKNVTDATVTPGEHRLTVTWKDPVENVPTETRVEYQRVGSNRWSDPLIVQPGTHDAVLNALDDDSSYRVRITAVQGHVASTGTIEEDWTSSRPHRQNLAASPAKISGTSGQTIQLNGTGTHFYTSNVNSVRLYDGVGTEIGDAFSSPSVNGAERMEVKLQRTLNDGTYRVVLNTAQDGILTTTLDVASGAPALQLGTLSTPSVPFKYDSFTMSLNGSGFTSSSKVTIDNGSPYSISYSDAQHLSFSLPRGLLPGTHKIRVQNGSGESQPLLFTVHPFQGELQMTAPTSRTGLYRNVLNVKNLDTNGRSAKILVVIRRNGQFVETREFSRSFTNDETAKISIDFGGANTPYADGPTTNISLQAFILDPYSATPLSEPIVLSRDDLNL